MKEQTIPLDQHAELIGLAMDMVNSWESLCRDERGEDADDIANGRACLEDSCEKVYDWIAKHPVRTEG